MGNRVLHSVSGFAWDIVGVGYPEQRGEVFCRMLSLEGIASGCGILWFVLWFVLCVVCCVCFFCEGLMLRCGKLFWLTSVLFFVLYWKSWWNFSNLAQESNIGIPFLRLMWVAD